MLAPRQGRSSRRLRFEKLEDRSLLAYGAFAVHLFEDSGGQPGDVIASDTVHVGESFFVEITAEDQLAEPRGFGGVSLHLAWDPSVLREVDANFDPRNVITPKLPAFPFGTLEQEAGRIDDLSGGAALAWGVGDVIGKEGPERFALLHFQALDTPGSSPFTLSSGSHGISHFPPVWGAAGNFTFERQTITVVDAGQAEPNETLTTVQEEVVSPTPTVTPADDESGSAKIAISVSAGSSATSSQPAVQFTTEDAFGSALVRPALPDASKFIDVSNTGDAALTIYEIQVNAQDVIVERGPSSGGDAALVVQPGETKRLGLTYAPRTPNATDTAVQSFDVSNGIVIVSNAANAAVVGVGLRGESTFDADTNYDGQVDLADLVLFDRHFGAQSGDGDYRPALDPNGDGVIDVADLRPFAAHFHLSREVPVVGPVQAAANAAAEGEGHASGVPSSSVCVAISDPRTSAALIPQDASRSASKAAARSKAFIGPVLPHEYATHLLLAEPASQLTSRADSSPVDDELIDLLATDLRPQQGQLLL